MAVQFSEPTRKTYIKKTSVSHRGRERDHQIVSITAKVEVGECNFWDTEIAFGAWFGPDIEVFVMSPS